MPRITGSAQRPLFSDVSPRLDAEFRKTGGAGTVRFENGKGLYVSRSGPRVPVSLALDRDLARDNYNHVKAINAMIKAGHAVKIQIAKSIKREYPDFRVIDNVTGRDVSLGTHVIRTANERKLDRWARCEAERIESELGNRTIDDNEIETPYHALTPLGRKALLSPDTDPAYRRTLIRNALTKKDTEIVLADYNAKDLEAINNYVRSSLNVFATRSANPELREMARDHIRIDADEALHPNSRLPVRRGERRNKIVMQNSLLRGAVIKDLRENNLFPGKEAAVAARIVANLQTSSEILSKSNLLAVAELLDGFVGDKDLTVSNLTRLEDVITLEGVVDGSVADGIIKNKNIWREAEQIAPEMMGGAIRNALRENNKALFAAWDLFEDGNYANADMRNLALKELMDSGVKLADLSRDLDEMIDEGRIDGDQVQAMVELRNEFDSQARRANELFQALRNPAIALEMPELRAVPPVESDRAPDALFANSEKVNAGKRQLYFAIMVDLNNDPTFDGRAQDVAQSIVEQLSHGREFLSPKNIATVQQTLDAFGYQHEAVDKLTELVNLNRKLSATGRQILDLNRAIQGHGIIKDLFDIDALHMTWRYDDEDEVVSAIDESNAIMRDISLFVHRGNLDDEDSRNTLIDRLKRNIGRFEISRMDIINDSKGEPLVYPWSTIVEHIEKQQAASYDMMNMLRTDSANGFDHSDIAHSFHVGVHRRQLEKIVDMNVLNEDVQPPSCIFKTEAAKARAENLLQPPLEQYNACLADVRSAFTSISTESDPGDEEYRRLLNAVSGALVLNSHASCMFSSLHRLRNKSSGPAGDIQLKRLHKQREQLQEIQVRAALGDLHPGAGVRVIPDDVVVTSGAKEERSIIRNIDDDISTESDDDDMAVISVSDKDDWETDVNKADFKVNKNDRIVDPDVNEHDLWGLSDDPVKSIDKSRNDGRGLSVVAENDAGDKAVADGSGRPKAGSLPQDETSPPASVRNAE